MEVLRNRHSVCVQVHLLVGGFWKSSGSLLSSNSSSCEISGGKWATQSASVSAGQLWCVCKCQSINVLARKAETVASTYRRVPGFLLHLKLKPVFAVIHPSGRSWKSCNRFWLGKCILQKTETPRRLLCLYLCLGCLRLHPAWDLS